jgi:hypothetical protein
MADRRGVMIAAGDGPYAGQPSLRIRRSTWTPAERPASLS